MGFGLCCHNGTHRVPKLSPRHVVKHRDERRLIDIAQVLYRCVSQC